MAIAIKAIKYIAASARWRVWYGDKDKVSYVPKEDVPDDDPEVAAVLQLFSQEQIAKLKASQERRKLVPLAQTWASLTRFVKVPPALEAEILALGPICDVGQLANILARDRRSSWILKPCRLVVQELLPYLLKQREGWFLVQFGTSCVAWDAEQQVVSTMESGGLRITPENLGVLALLPDRVYRLLSKNEKHNHTKNCGGMVAQAKFQSLQRFDIYADSSWVVYNHHELSYPSSVHEWLVFLNRLAQSAQWAGHHETVNRETAAAAAIELINSLNSIKRQDTDDRAQFLFLRLFFEVERTLPLMFLGLFRPALDKIGVSITLITEELSRDCSFQERCFPDRRTSYHTQLQRCHDVFGWLRIICLCHLEDVSTLALQTWKSQLPLWERLGTNFGLDEHPMADRRMPFYQTYSWLSACVQRCLLDDVRSLDLACERLEKHTDCHFFGVNAQCEIYLTKRVNVNATAARAYLSKQEPGVPCLVRARCAYLCGLASLEDLEKARDTALQVCVDGAGFTSADNVRAWFAACVTEHKRATLGGREAEEKVGGAEVDVDVEMDLSPRSPRLSHKRRRADGHGAQGGAQQDAQDARDSQDADVVKRLRAELRTWIRARVKPEFLQVEQYEQVTPRAVELLRKQAKKSGKIRFENNKAAYNPKILDFFEKGNPFNMSPVTERRSLLPGDPRGMYGLFAKTKLDAYHVVGAYKGSLWSADEFEDQFLNHPGEDRVLDYAFDAYLDFSPKAEDHFVLVAHNFDDANELAFANDYRPDPATQNAEFVSVCWKNLPFVVLITTKEIQQDKEVIVDYGAKYWKRNKSCAAELIRRLWALLPEESEKLFE